jgi:two-component system, OmpR family, copper resistance phosphate regulon response regulator CusR
MSGSYNILFVDDDNDTCEMMCLLLMLNISDCEVLSAQTAAEALALIKTQSFDIYILDYLLPDMTGLDLCDQIRQTDGQTPIMFYSGMTHIVDKESAKAAGANEFLVKPDDLEKLPEKIELYLR